jgi:hypothetical protein
MKFLTLAPALLLALAPLSALAQDSGDQPIRVKVTQRDDGTHVSSTVDPNAHTCVEETLTNKEKLIQKVVYQLDAANRPMSGVVTDPAGNVLYNMKLIHDDAGRVTEESDYSKTGELVRHLIYHYSTAGLLTGVDAYDGQGNVLKRASEARKDKKKSLPRINP